MKLPSAVYITALLAASGGSAVAVERRQDKQCSVAGTFATVNCRSGPGRDFAAVHKLVPSQSFGVSCIVDGEAIDGEKAWGYLPTWDCWLAIRWTDLGCKRYLPVCAK
ncbi:hypothetical protein B0H63DRAFT_455825 [Podospora didyma]|uniref:Uncharacterized protein n=1 Tax=Podospora didyma TaxID=330526 RepID=A0AAE0N2F6_9PEZI|nr:hypothetical protein B0H63DRAFT_455825 [Podospora didyma]